jgi:hypothetical protein
MAVELKLTDREIAIARGEDPDKVVVSKSSPPVAEMNDDEEEGSEEVTEEGSEESLEEGSSSGQEEGSEEEVGEEVDSWVDDNVRELAESYGFSDDDLKGFGSAEEFRRAGLLFDRAFFGDGEKKQQAKPKEPPAAEEKPAPPVADDDASIEFKPPVDESLFSDGYGEHEVAMVKAVNAQAKELADLRAFVRSQQQLVQAQQEEAQRRHFDEFHRICDDLNPDLLGRAFAETGTVNNLDEGLHGKRAKLWEAAETIRSGIFSRAQEKGVAPKLPSERVLIERAYGLAFPDEVKKSVVNKRTSAAKSQAARKRSVGNLGGSRNPSFVGNKFDPGAIANDPKLSAFFDKAQRENGAL